MSLFLESFHFLFVMQVYVLSSHIAIFCLFIRNKCLFVRNLPFFGYGLNMRINKDIYRKLSYTFWILSMNIYVSNNCKFNESDHFNSKKHFSYMIVLGICDSDESIM